MLILDTLTKVHDGTLSIPEYHRGHLSLKSGTSVTLCLLPCNTNDNSPRLTEMIISPIAFDSWDYLTRINARLYDKPGVVRKLATAIRSKDLNVLYEVSGPVENRKLHRVEFLVDAKNFYRKFEGFGDRNSDFDFIVLSELEHWIKAICINELVFDRSRLRLKVRPMEGFRNAYRNFIHCETDSGLRLQPLQERSIINNGKIALPENILRSLPDDKRVLLVSDTKDRVLRAFFLHPDEHYTYLRVLHNDSPGSLAAISSCLSEYFYTITTLSRLKVQGQRNDVELLLFSSDLPLENQENERKELIERILSQQKLQNLDIEISYPEAVGRVGPKPNKPRIFSIPSQTDKLLSNRINDLISLEENLLGKSTSQILRERIDSYVEIVKNEPLPEKVDFYNRRLVVVRELLSHLADDTIPSPKIFISYNFRFHDLFNIAKQQLESHKCQVIDGTKPVGNITAYRDVIIDRIRSSGGFVGIWKMDMDQEGDQRFSPWMLWELGVAQAFGIPYFLFSHENLSNLTSKPHTRINPEQHHDNFKDSQFENNIAKILPAFLAKVTQYEKIKLAKGLNTFTLTN